MRLRIGLVLLPLIVIAASCGGSGDGYGSGPSSTTGGSTGSTSTSISVKNNVFDPAATTVAVGSTVNWTWAQGATDHNVTFDDGQKSATQSTGGYARVFGSAGKFAYHCTLHPSMTGTVTVQ
jgi:plastocyanin